MSDRPVPVPDEVTAPFWEAASRHELTVARCTACEARVVAPGSVCPECGTTEPAFRFDPVSGNGTLRSWAVVRQSFLPGFEVPFVLVDVELDEQVDLRMIGRLLDGVAAIDEPGLSVGTPVRVAFEDVAVDVAVPAFVLADGTDRTRP